MPPSSLGEVRSARESDPLRTGERSRTAIGSLPCGAPRTLARRGGVLGQNGRMDLGLRGRVYLVTGGSRGLGFAAAQALTAEGARVVLSAPHEATADRKSVG